MGKHGDRPFQCTTCKYTARLYSRVRRHIREVHEKLNQKEPKKKIEKKPIEPKTIATKKSHKKYKCTVCTYGSDVQSYLDWHMSTVHKIGSDAAK